MVSPFLAEGRRITWQGPIQRVGPGGREKSSLSTATGQGHGMALRKKKKRTNRDPSLKEGGEKKGDKGAPFGQQEDRKTHTYFLPVGRRAKKEGNPALNKMLEGGENLPQICNEKPLEKSSFLEREKASPVMRRKTRPFVLEETEATGKKKGGGGR